MSLLVLGLNHHTAPLELRERLTIDREQLKDALARLTQVGTKVGMAQNGQEEEAVEKLLSRLLDTGQTDLCSNLGKCSSDGCGVRPKKKVRERVS